MGWREGSIFCYMEIMSYSLFLGGILFLRVCLEHARQIGCWKKGRAFLISLIAGTLLSTPIHRVCEKMRVYASGKEKAFEKRR